MSHGLGGGLFETLDYLGADGTHLAGSEGGHFSSLAQALAAKNAQVLAYGGGAGTFPIALTAANTPALLFSRNVELTVSQKLALKHLFESLRPYLALSKEVVTVLGQIEKFMVLTGMFVSTLAAALGNSVTCLTTLSSDLEVIRTVLTDLDHFDDGYPNMMVTAAKRCFRFHHIYQGQFFLRKLQELVSSVPATGVGKHVTSVYSFQFDASQKLLEQLTSFEKLVTVASANTPNPMPVWIFTLPSLHLVSSSCWRPISVCCALLIVENLN